MFPLRSSSYLRSILITPTAPNIQKYPHRNSFLASSRYNSSKSLSTTSSSSNKKPSYTPSPSPPALPPKEQKEFISLINQSNSSPQDQNKNNQTHPDLRNLGPEEFQGDINPKTGEVNGPKRDPLKWPNEWGYGGRVKQSSLHSYQFLFTSETVN
jgi:hypothetical protein